METYNKQMMEALELFFKDDSGDVVEYMESILYEWYQYHALEFHQVDHPQGDPFDYRFAS